MRSVLGLTLVLLVAPMGADGSWGRANCGPVGSPAMTATTTHHYIATGPTAESDSWAKRTGHVWIQSTLHPGKFFLYKDYKQVGTWNGKTYLPYASGSYMAQETLPPWAPKAMVHEGPPAVRFAPMNQSQVDRDAILRRGSQVERIDGSPRDEAAELWGQVSAPPPSDRWKWFISVISKDGCPAATKLRQDWTTNENLRAMAKPELNNQNESWAFFNWYDENDQSQSWRWKDIRVSSPTVIIQPPRNGSYGDPSIIVFQQTYAGSPDRFAKSMQSAIKRYLADLPKEMAPLPVLLNQKKAVGGDPPWTPPPKTPGPPNPNVTPSVNPVTIPPEPPAIVPAAVGSFLAFLLPLLPILGGFPLLLYLPRLKAMVAK